MPGVEAAPGAATLAEGAGLGASATVLFQVARAGHRQAAVGPVLGPRVGAAAGPPA